MEKTPQHTRRLREAIKSLVGSEEPSYLKDDDRDSILEAEEDKPARGRPRIPI